MVKVLIVEDYPMIAVINKRFVQQIENAEVFGPVMYEEEVLEVLKNEDIDLIILDVFLPKKNGIDILKSIRNKKYLTDVIMVTAANNVEEIKKAFAYGVVDYLVKPFEFDRFEEAYKKFKKKNDILYKNKGLVQSDIDKMFNENSSKKIQEEILPKGLNKRTLDKIVDFLMDNSEKVWTLREIAYEIKISNVTIKKYMDYLESMDRISVEMTSGNIGRPELKYSINKEKLFKYGIIM